MDQATAAKIANNYGVPPSARNLSLIMQEAPNESALLGRSMGMQGGASEEGYDDSILKSRLNKMADDTAPKGTVTVGQPQVEKIAAPSTINNPRAGAATLPKGPSGPTPGSRGDELNTPTATAAAPSKQRMSGYETDPGVSATNSPEGDSGFLPWLIGLLGAGAGAAKAGMGGPNGAPPIQPQPQLPSPIARTQIAGPGSNPQLTYEPKLTGPADTAAYPGGAPNTTEGPPAPAQAAPQSVVRQPKPTPVRPEFSSTEMLMDAVRDFNKGFQKLPRRIR